LDLRCANERLLETPWFGEVPLLAKMGTKVSEDHFVAAG
jgi:hypothetical protein